MAQVSVFEIAFKSELSKFSPAEGVVDGFWQEIEHNYSARGRYYHNLTHLNNVFGELLQLKELIIDWQTIIISIAYHDFIYDVMTQNNEEKSAAEAVKKLKSLDATAEQQEKCREQILATKGHHISSDSDTNYFTDADLAILGADADSYDAYAGQIRKEYRFYPDIIYKPGRKKVLNHFLDMERIFKTDYFFKKYEQEARINLKKELELL